MPAPDVVAEYRAAGWWRGSTFLDDLATAVRERGDHPALVSYEGTEHARTLSFAELATLVERFASALRELGVQRGDVVVTYLPNMWILPALYLACHRISAVSAPVMPMLGKRELAEVLVATGAKVCVTVAEYNGVDYTVQLADAVPETVLHRVVVGGHGAAGTVDFEEFFVRTPWEERRPVPESERLGPDEPAQLLFTSGTTGARKGAAHSQNTIYAAVRSVSDPHRLTADDVISMPNSHAHMAGMSYGVYMSLFLGATCVTQDVTTDLELLRDLVAEHGVTWLYCAPGPLTGLLAAQEKDARDTAALKQIVSGSAPVQPQLITRVRDVFGVPLYALWGMTENGGVTVTGPADPDGWAGHSDGSSMPWMEIHIDAEAGEEAGRLLVRGASQCLGYLGQRDIYAACVDADGWFDTGDLARPDGRGGIRITGRRVDLITRANGEKVSTLEIESVLQRHPDIDEVVLIGYPDPAVPGADLVCAIIVPGDIAITLADADAFLIAEGVSDGQRPDRVQLVESLPKNSLGKVLRQPLRERIEIAESVRT